MLHGHKSLAQHAFIIYHKGEEGSPWLVTEGKGTAWFVRV
jgi:hypothetical protein